MKKKQKIKQILFALIVNGLIFMWLWLGIATATTLR